MEEKSISPLALAFISPTEFPPRFFLYTRGSDLCSRHDLNAGTVFTVAVTLQRSASAKCVYRNVNVCTQRERSSEIDWSRRYGCALQTAGTGQILKMQLFH